MVLNFTPERCPQSGHRPACVARPPESRTATAAEPSGAKRLRSKFTAARPSINLGVRKCTHTQKHACVCTHQPLINLLRVPCIYTRTHTSMHTDELVEGTAHMYACTRACTYTHTHAHTHARVRARTHTHTHARTRTHACMHTHACMYTHTAQVQMARLLYYTSLLAFVSAFL